MRRWAAAVLTLLAATASADERILNYHSDIDVKADGWIAVTETITVRAEGQQIRRGIYRDFPVRYVDRRGNAVRVVFEPRAVLRDGEPEPFHMQTVGRYERTYFGSSDRLLAPGVHTYTFRYDVGRILGFFETRDELYWNVTGDRWDFPIDAASATVALPFDVAPGDLILTAYTGAFGARGSAYAATVDAAGRANFEITSPLAVREGLTVVVEWPKGRIAAPSGMQKFIWLLTDNLNLLIALAGLAAMLGYYVPVWRHYGKDPEPGVVFTRYEPPAGFSPASLRYIDRMGYDDEAMTAAVINLAVKGYLRIDADDDDYTLVRTTPRGEPPPLAAGETELYDALFEDGERLELVNDNHERVGHARDAHKRSLRFDYHKRYFVTNGVLNVPAILIGVIAAAVALRIRVSLDAGLVIAAMVATVVIFAIIMKRPTGPGRRLLDEVDGFREYLEVAEKDEMHLRNPPEKTPRLFERYLPFALALGVEQQWAERFSRIFASLEGPNGTAWQPAWYGGSWNSSNFSANMSGLSGGLGSAIGSAATPPGSSSGGGGGGFSGGGGGGGGGGGW